MIRLTDAQHQKLMPHFPFISLRVNVFHGQPVGRNTHSEFNRKKKKQLKTKTMKSRMDRKEIVIGKSKEFAALDRKNNNEMTIQEKRETVTYLRKCFYSPETTTGRVQRSYTILKQK